MTLFRGHKREICAELPAEFLSDSSMWKKGTGLVSSIKPDAPSLLAGSLDGCYSQRVHERGGGAFALVEAGCFLWLSSLGVIIRTVHPTHYPMRNGLVGSPVATGS